MIVWIALVCIIAVATFSRDFTSDKVAIRPAKVLIVDVLGNGYSSDYYYLSHFASPAVIVIKRKSDGAIIAQSNGQSRYTWQGGIDV